jgi:hypothetical protein
LRRELFPASVSSLSWSQLLMDGKELDDIHYICYVGCRSAQFRSVSRIAPKTQF